MIDTDRLKQATNELNQVTDILNKYLQSIEDELKEISPGLICWINLDNDKMVKYGYYRFGDGWHLAVRVGDEEPRQILQAARYYRYMCYKQRQKIIDALFELITATNQRWKKALDGNETVEESSEIDD